MNDSAVISDLSGSHIGACARIIAGAFFDKEPFTWLLPDREQRTRVFPAFAESMFRYAHPPGAGTQVALNASGVLGCAAWEAPGHRKHGVLRDLAASFFMMRRIRFRDLQSFGKRGSELQKAMAAARPEAPHWYLAALAVAPEAQGKGVGTALLRAGLDRCDATGEATYLECLEHLEPYYQRFGFTRTHWVELPAGTPRQAGMWRPAQRA
jgi:GNAT superfamily N-acetyltransferase